MASLHTLLILCGCATALCLPTSSLTGNTVIDVDNGKGQDIFEINEAAGLDLVEGDILINEGEYRNTILDEKYRWPTTVPYVLDSSLDINAKGVVLRALEQYRLKTCIDFKPWDGEPNYIFVFKGKGCYSYVGNQRKGKQELSIGANCDDLGTVEHEFLHALGFWHEQSRSDRDDYVTIMWDQIEEGKEQNFNSYDETVSSSLGVPYDYGSVMHYSKTSFSKGSEPTIVTKIPEFLDVIGQHMEFSDSDLIKLNRLYNCTTASIFLDSCQFEEPNICGMIQGDGGNAKWARVQRVKDGPQTDYTNLGQCKGVGFFMHFSTATGTKGKNAFLESRLFHPKRRSQCLQFYHYNSGSVDDQLNIWVREYTVKNPKGALRLIQKISGGLRGSWELYNVTLNVSDKFRVVFEGVKGRKPSKGGLSLDDINLSETKCPQFTWRIRDFTRLLATTPAGSKTYSPRFLSPDGYSFQIGLYINGLKDSPHMMAIYLHLTSGPKDNNLQWPCPWRQASMELMDQNPDIQHRMNNIKMITTDPNMTFTDSTCNVKYFWDNPRKVGSLVTDTDGSKFYRGRGYGTSHYITHDHLKSRSFIKGDDVIFLLSLEDVTGLLGTQTRESWRPEIRDLRLEIDDRDAGEPKRQMVNPTVLGPWNKRSP
ncbi:meprin A subunit beta-like isoform X1 [Carassius carassius]|uniref:meprin A subunit beta-like isoform X1 n=1 Tax=Carassius carassius TaxID=217509 RepID=UPI002869215D|nr:meprin A subunit beta-like isoform X1 [Carassius carassius]XP_059369047.1 meprin A subunit beta-like isoform X1 [Carassius carassius]